MAELKYYAQPIDPEMFRYEDYYDEFDASYDKVWCGGNREFEEINASLVNDVLRNLEYCGSDIDDTLNSDTYDEDEKIRSINDTINYYFKREDGNPLTGKQVKTLFKLINSDWFEEKLDTVCQVLEIIYGKPFSHGQIRGNSQGDWLNIVYPSSMKQEKINYIEAVLFATGTEFAVTEEKIDDPSKFDQADFYTYYTYKYNESDIKQEIADHLMCSPDEVEILEAN